MTFPEFIRSCGIIPPLNLEPGRWIACATNDRPHAKHANVKLAADEMVGWVQDFRSMPKPVLWRAAGDSVPTTTISPAEIRSRQLQRAREQAAASESARRFHAQATPLLNGHPYLTRKKLSTMGCLGLRVDAKGRLVVPMFIGRQLASVQTITEDGVKLFWSGAPISGACYRIERQRPALTILAEGLATALTVFAAVRDSNVIVCFSAFNILKVAKSLRPKGMVVVAADNDHETAARLGHNPGIEGANAAAACLGCGVAIPEFDNQPGSDWNDWRTARLAVLTELALGQKYANQDITRQVAAEITAEIYKAARLVPWPQAPTINKF